MAARLLAAHAQLAHESGHVLGALLERGDAQRHDGEPEVEVLAERAGSDAFRKVPVGRRQDADVGRDRPGPADAGDASVLDRAEDLPAIQQDLATARAEGITATPSFRLNGQRLVGARSIDAFTQAIDAELAKLGR